jgi:hypothetical protein
MGNAKCQSSNEKLQRVGWFYWFDWLYPKIQISRWVMSYEKGTFP